MIIPPPRESGPTRKPDWLKVRFPDHSNCFSIASLLEGKGLRTICRSARCPNLGECWSRKTATFLILGGVCTRTCGFCAVPKGTPAPPSNSEPDEVAEAAATLGLKYVVVTSVTRDDLPDGGAAQFARTIRALRRAIPGVRVEVLVPDFGGSERPLREVLDAAPDVLNHNLETVEALYPRIGRPGENYSRSLGLLRRAKDLGAATKSGLMLGLGESDEELRRTLADLRGVACDLLTLGQYLQPTRAHVPVARYSAPAEFDAWRAEALALGFAGVESGPLVRSSFQAHRLYDRVMAFPQDGSCDT